MEERLRAYILIALYASSSAWPRYGRPHPLYYGRLQTSENIFANAILLGLDYSDLRSLQAASGDAFGLGNLGLPNSGFPMNVYERRRARQDANTLTALGVIDGPEEAGPYGPLIRRNRPDPPDNPSGRDGAGKNKKKAGKKRKGKGKSKLAKGANKSKKATTDANVQPTRSQTVNNPSLENVTKITNKEGVIRNTQINKDTKPKTTGIATQGFKAAMARKKIDTKVDKVRQQNLRTHSGKVNNRQGKKDGAKRSKKRKTKRKRGNNWEGGDPGEGRLAEQGEIPLKARRKRVLWRLSGSEDAQIGINEFNEYNLMRQNFS